MSIENGDKSKEIKEKDEKICDDDWNCENC
jgi:hypothetical protein